MRLGLLYLVITLMCLFHINEAFECQTCAASGNRLGYVIEECHKNATTEECKADIEDPVCVLYLDYSGRKNNVERFCASRDDLNTIKRRCDRSSSFDDFCAVAMCDESGCNAQLSTTVKKCPSCLSTTSLEDCNGKIKTRTCHSLFTDRFACAVIQYNQDFYSRTCVSDFAFTNVRAEKFAMCMEDKCLANFTFTAVGVNRCPKCKAKTLEECDQTREMEECRGPDPFSNVCTLEKDKGENGKYYRKCMTRYAYEKSKAWSSLEKIAFCEKNECFASFW